MLPRPSSEQSVALRVWAEGKNQVCSAAAGGGKSTLLLHACASSAEPVLVLAYNKPLAVEMTEKLALFGIDHAQCFTFHGLCSHVYRLTPDDAVMHEVIAQVNGGEIEPRHRLAARRVCVDESQDMRDVYFRLVELLLPISEVQWLLVGDEMQMLYDYDDEDPARPDFMRTPERFFAPTDWVRTRLSVSFRLTPPLAALANALLDGEELAPGNGRANPPRSTIVTCTPSAWEKKVPSYMRQLLLQLAPSKVALLVPSVRASGNRPVLNLINALTIAGIPLYIHGTDGADPRIQKDKVIVSTWHAAKGMQYEATIVLGVGEDSKHNPLHVAMTRSQGEQVVFHDRRKPRRKFLEAMISARDSVYQDHETSELVQRRADLPSGEAETIAPPGARDLDRWNPRGRCAALHALVEDCGEQHGGGDALEGEIVVRGRTTWENVTRLYPLAVRMRAEDAARGDCLRVRAMLTPQYVHKNKLDDEIAAANQARLVTLGISRDQMLPATVRAMISEICERPARTHNDWCTLATAADAWCTYHHLALRILPAQWADASLLDTLGARLQSWLGADCAYDVLLTREADSTRFYARCHALSRGVAFTVVYEEDISPALRLRACIPMALCPGVSRCAVLNLRTNTAHVLALRDRDAFLETLHEFL